MTVSAAKLQDVAAEWRAARRVYPIYAAVLRRFDLPVPRCKELESPIDRADPDCVNAMREWLTQMDSATEIAHLRLVLQTENLGTEQNLLALLQRYLNVSDELEQFRDKVDYLLVQYFSQAAPDEMHTRPVKLEDVARVLEPVLGEASLRLPSFMGALEMLLVRLGQCASLADVLREGILAQGRAIKKQAGPMYFGSGVLLAFTRYNFLVRRSFMRLLQEDLKRIGTMLNELEARDVFTVDCTNTELASVAPTAELRRVVRDWRTIYRADYHAGHSFQLIADIRAAAEAALAAAPEKKVPLQIVVHEEEVGPEDHLALQATVLSPEPPLKDRSTDLLQNSQVATTRGVDIQAALDAISEQLSSRDLLNQHLPVSTVKMGESRVLLSSWEVAAYLTGTDQRSQTLQRAVAVRAVLLEAIRCCRETRNTHELGPIMGVARAQLATMQEAIAEARDARNIDAAVNLAATGKRLNTAMDEAEKLAAGETSN